jgi:hypothetical protein
MSLASCGSSSQESVQAEVKERRAPSGTQVLDDAAQRRRASWSPR